MDRSAYDAFVELDRRHFWRVAKRKLVLETVAGLLDGQPDLRILDVGGACSLMTRALGAFGEVTCVEPDDKTLQLARDVLGVDAVRGSLPDDLPPCPPGGLITLLDVLEHVEEEAQALHAIHDSLAPGGWLVCTVPAYKWLWSEHDEALHHKRRYTRARLVAALDRAGFEIRRITYYTSLLLPVLAAQRALLNLRRRKHQPARYSVTVPCRPLNALCGSTMHLERLLLRHVDLPCGSALLAVAQRPAA